MSIKLKEQNAAASGGIGFTGVLQIVFIVLKLCKVINWSWFWVLSPTWISVALIVLVILIVPIIMMIAD